VQLFCNSLHGENSLPQFEVTQRKMPKDLFSRRRFETFLLQTVFKGAIS